MRVASLCVLFIALSLLLPSCASHEDNELVQTTDSSSETVETTAITFPAEHTTNSADEE